MAAALAADAICATPGCGKPAKMQCPKCVEWKLPRTYFCDQTCFKGYYKTHDRVHQEAKAISEYRPPSFRYTGPLRPAWVSPMRSVPDHIEKPEYAKTVTPLLEDAAKASFKIHINNPEEIAGIREACRIGREVLDIAAKAIRVGITTDEIDRIVHEATIARNSYPSPLNYHFFPKSCCTSVNEVICHGIPDARPLADGDIVNIDISVYHKGFHGDLNETYFVGKVDEDSKRLVKTTYQSLMEAIKAVRPNAMCRDFGEIIQKVVRKHGYGVVRTYCGHGVGRLFHAPPNIPHYARNKAVGVLKPGMVFTIEPMINMGGWEDVTWEFDDWTSVTKDGERSAQFEHTVLVTETGCEVLTARTKDSPPLFLSEADAKSVLEGATTAATDGDKKDSDKSKDAKEGGKEAKAPASESESKEASGKAKKKQKDKKKKAAAKKKGKATGDKDKDTDKSASAAAPAAAQNGDKEKAADTPASTASAPAAAEPAKQ